MKRAVQNLLLVVLLIPALAGVALPQNRPPVGPPVKIEVVLSKFQGDKKISSVPFTLSVNANDSGVSLRMDSQIPVPTKEGYNYQSVGTNIDCTVTSAEADRFKVQLTVFDSSVTERGPGEPAGVVGVPRLRSFRTVNSVLLRDGQTSQFTAATDKISGEVFKVDVTLNVEK